MPKYVTNNILISLLAEYGVKDLVLSSGARNIPFVSAVETDERFRCYSVIDERNAAFFGMGISQQINQPVGIACTSGTAASNYLTGVTEAFYSHTPLIVITFDRSPYALNQLETQKIDQMAIFKGVVKKSVNLPLIKDDDDIWYCQRLVNEALIAMMQHQPGPVHINVPLVGDQNRLVSESVVQDTLDSVVKIDYIADNNDSKFDEYAEKLCGKKPMIIMGQAANLTDETKNAIKRFAKAYNCPVVADNLANFKCDELVFAEGLFKALNSKLIEKMVPDVIISFGANFQERIKDIMRAHRNEFEHWLIEPEGVVKDVFKAQRALFECTPEKFFTSLADRAKENACSDEYLKKWKKLESAVVLPEMPFTNFYTVGEFVKVIPKNSILHLAILNSTRLMQFYNLDESITVYSNVNSFGIDGCLPTFMGQAAVSGKLSFMLTGDLSFFYGMNAAAIKHRSNNIRIIVVNNGGGAEFHIMPDSNSIPTIDLHIGCAHERSVKGWVESMNYEYMTANDKDSLAKVLPDFVSENHENPVVLEVFTNMKEDGEHLLSVYRALEKCITPVIEEL